MDDTGRWLDTWRGGVNVVSAGTNCDGSDVSEEPCGSSLRHIGSESSASYSRSQFPSPGVSCASEKALSSLATFTDAKGLLLDSPLRSEGVRRAVIDCDSSLCLQGLARASTPDRLRSRTTSPTAARHLHAPFDNPTARTRQVGRLVSPPAAFFDAAMDSSGTSTDRDHPGIAV